jgi:hypothetical protein
MKANVKEGIKLVYTTGRDKVDVNKLNKEIRGNISGY